MSSRAAENLGKRLDRERIRRFVGRSRKLELFATWLEASSNRDVAPNGQALFNVLWRARHATSNSTSASRSFVLLVGHVLKRFPRRLLTLVDGVLGPLQWSSVAETRLVASGGRFIGGLVGWVLAGVWSRIRGHGISEQHLAAIGLVVGHKARESWATTSASLCQGNAHVHISFAH